MILLPKTLSTWQSPTFSDTLKQEIKQLPTNMLPLQQALSHGNFANTDNLDIMILSITDDKSTIQAKVGIFFTSIISGCQCSDDPTPINEENEYCELMLNINKNTSTSTITLLT